MITCNCLKDVFLLKNRTSLIDMPKCQEKMGIRCFSRFSISSFLFIHKKILMSFFSFLYFFPLKLSWIQINMETLSQLWRFKFIIFMLLSLYTQKTINLKHEIIFYKLKHLKPIRYRTLYRIWRTCTAKYTCSLGQVSHNN